ncbi:hypothetical protein N7495_008293 [Penicillium taxi]|uniref:uncharacterized protein n=1 Tax=Penicillium taxi TaxID=168475 RepID=UPI00254526C1|nr:uncharacterized protein N7495_008293 [Penicillium taxi]KAJ5888252.1 hypothetical protein N7495_008293 [Penicillium taxi]
MAIRPNSHCTPIVIEDVPIPVAGLRQILVKVLAASLCGTDLSVVDGAYGERQFPLIIGHEAVGLVHMLGPGVEPFGFQVGQIIGSAPYRDMCLECYECRYHGPEFCAKTKMQGVFAPGFFAEYCIMDAASAVVIKGFESKEELVQSVESLSPIFCAGVSVWDAFERAKLARGETLAIIGVGGVGQLAVQYASAMGVRVIAVDVREEQLRAVARSNPGIQTINKTGLGFRGVQERIEALRNGHYGADVVIVCTGAAIAYQTAFYCVGALGRIMVLGLPKNPIQIQAFHLSARCYR